MLSPDTYLQNRFRIICPLGKGGMGRVYAATDEALDCTVAIKQTFATSEQLRRAFKREAKLLANLRHPVLPRVTHHFFEGNEQFLVMDYIEGENLETLLKKRQRPFSCSEVLSLADKLLDALEYLHNFREPIIHRDIKPANIKLTDNGNVFLLDFGLAKGIVGQATTQGSGHLSVYGYTANYAPMEQISSSGTNAQSDLYSLGATLYHLLTGKVPASSGDRYVQLEQEMSDPILPAHQLNSEIPSSLSVVLSQAMEMSRKNRFASAAKMRQALRDTVLFDDISKATLAPTIKLNQPNKQSLEQTAAFASVDYPLNLETVPMTNQPAATLQADFTQSQFADSVVTEADTSWASHIVTDSTQTTNKNMSLAQKFYKTIALPSFLQLSSSLDSSSSVSKSKQIITISMSAIVLVGLLVFSQGSIDGNLSEPRTVVSG